MSYTITASDTSIQSMQDQINLLGISNDGLACNGDQMTVLGSFTESEKTTIDGLVAAGKLDYAKDSKLTAVKNKTVVLIDEGFTHSAMKFPLVLDHRSNYIGIQVFGGFPYKIQSIDQHNVLQVADQAAYNLFIVDGLSRYRYVKDGESDLIILIRDATTIPAVDAITDSRT